MPRVRDYAGFLDAWSAQALAPRKADAPTLVSLFAGAGGSGTGYRMVGYDARLAVDFWDRAVETYRANWGEDSAMQADVSQLTAADVLRAAGLDVGELDTLDGSPPCQGFSTAGKRLVDDPRNQLFVHFARLVKDLRPRSFVMENVAGLVKGVMRPAFRAMTEHLRKQGYDVRCKLLDASWLGVPQTRQRLIWIGSRDKLPEPMDVHPGPTWRQVGMAAGLAGLGFTAKSVYGAGGQLGVADRLEKGVEPYGDEWKEHVRGVERPAPTVTAKRPHVVREPKVLSNLARGRYEPRSQEKPAPTLTGRLPHVVNDGDEHVGPQNRKQKKPRRGEDPAHAVTTRPNVVRSRNGALDSREPRPDTEPAPTVDTKGLAVRRQADHGAGLDVNDANVRVWNEGTPGRSRSKGRKGDEPAPTITGRTIIGDQAATPVSRHAAQRTRDKARRSPKSADEPSPAVDTRGVSIKELAHAYKSGREIPGHKPAPPVAALMADKRIKTEDGPWRPLTHQECARLQSFPDWYEWRGSESDRVKQIGNAVPCLMAAQNGVAVARHVLRWEGVPNPQEVARPWTS